MKRYLYIYIIVLAALLSSCNDFGDDAQISPRENMKEVEQVTIMYFLGTNLWWFFDTFNLPGVRSAVADGVLGDGGRLFVLKSSSAYKSELYEIYEKNGSYKTERVKLYSDRTSKLSATSQRMTEVIEEVQDYASAKRYNLIMSGHGTGWVLQSHPYLRSINSSYVDWEQMGQGDFVTRFMGGSEDGFMEVTEFRRGLEMTSTKFGYILFDMCFMSNIESLYELRDVCDNVIASPCEVMGYGFPYEAVLPELFAEGGVTTNYSGACEAYYNFYNNHESDPYGAVAWCVTSELEGVASAMQQINTAGVESVSILDVQFYDPLPNHIYCDLRDYVSKASKDAALLEAFESNLDRAFPKDGRRHTPSFLSTLISSYNPDIIPIDKDVYSGVTTSEPSVMYRDEWVDTSWAQATRAVVAD